MDGDLHDDDGEAGDSEQQLRFVGVFGASRDIVLSEDGRSARKVGGRPGSYAHLVTGVLQEGASGACAFSLPREDPDDAFSRHELEHLWVSLVAADKFVLPPSVAAAAGAVGRRAGVRKKGGPIARDADVWPLHVKTGTVGDASPCPDCPEDTVKENAVLTVLFDGGGSTGAGARTLRFKLDGRWFEGGTTGFGGESDIPGRVRLCVSMGAEGNHVRMLGGSLKLETAAAAACETAVLVAEAAGAGGGGGGGAGLPSSGVVAAAAAAAAAVAAVPTAPAAAKSCCAAATDDDDGSLVSPVRALFVYGSLRPDDDSGMPWTTAFTAGMVCARATLRGAAMYEDSYACVVLGKGTAVAGKDGDDDDDACTGNPAAGADGVVVGCVLTLPPPAGAAAFARKLAEADQIEGYPDLYRRATVCVRLETGGTMLALVYHRPGCDRSRRIPGGDWLLRHTT